MGLPLYKPRSSGSESDALAKCRSKTDPRQSIRRRVRADYLARREQSRRQQREVFLANFINERESDEDSAADAAPNPAPNPPAPRPNLSYVSLPALYPDSPSHIHIHAPRSDLPHFPPRPLIVNGREVEVLDFVFPRVQDDSERTASGGTRRVVDGRTFERIQEYRRRYWEQYRSAEGSSALPSSSYDPWLAYLRTSGHPLEVMGGASAQMPVPSVSPSRNRMASPEHDEFWDTLQTTLTPDPQPPSAGSSFASAAGSAPSPRPTASIHLSRPTHHDCGGVCDICSRHGRQRPSANFRLRIRPRERHQRSRSGESRGNTPRPPPPPPPPNDLRGTVRRHIRARRRNGTEPPAGLDVPSDGGGGGGGRDGADAGTGAPELSPFDSELVRALRSTEARFPMATPGFEGLDAFRRATYARLGLPQDFIEDSHEDEGAEEGEEGIDDEPYDIEEHHASHYPWDRFY